MAFSIYDASVPICAQQLGALAVIAGKAADHCATNKIEEAALLTDRLYPDMFCLARQFRQAADFGRHDTGPSGRRRRARTSPRWMIPASRQPKSAAKIRSRSSTR